MRKILLLFILFISITSSAYSQEYEVRHAPPRYYQYTLDEQLNDIDASTYLGVITRFGYSFSDNGYFTYGASIYYTFNSVIGVTAGFDAYAGKIYIYDDHNNIIRYNGPYSSLPIWNIRAGVTLGKYISLGVIYGQCRICKTDCIVVHKYSDHLTTNVGESGGFWGAFGTVIAPISTRFALDFDISYTSHTSFALSAGLIIRFKIK